MEGSLSLIRRQREVKRESRSHLGSGVRPARERACRRRNPLSFSFLVPAAVLSSSSSVTALSELWIFTFRGGSVHGAKTRLFGVVGVVRTFVRWFCFREMEALTASSSPAIVTAGWKFPLLHRRRLKSPGSEGYLSFSSPVSGF
ncbi:hypothetical protein YC2023_056122 [Brassica napus]